MSLNGLVLVKKGIQINFKDEARAEEGLFGVKDQSCLAECKSICLLSGMFAGASLVFASKGAVQKAAYAHLPLYS